MFITPYNPCFHVRNHGRVHNAVEAFLVIVDLGKSMTDLPRAVELHQGKGIVASTNIARGGKCGRNVGEIHCVFDTITGGNQPKMIYMNMGAMSPLEVGDEHILARVPDFLAGINNECNVWAALCESGQWTLHPDVQK